MLAKTVAFGRCSHWLLWRRRLALPLIIKSTQYLIYPVPSILVGNWRSIFIQIVWPNCNRNEKI